MTKPWSVTEGDCLAVLPTLPEASADMVLCDLPYGTTQNAWDSVIPLAPWWAAVRRVAKPNAAIVLFAQCPFDKVLGASNLDELKYEWIWRKESGTGHLNAKIAPMKDHENLLVFYRSQPTYNPQMRRSFKPIAAPQRQGGNGSNYGSTTRPIYADDGTRHPLTTIEFARDADKVHPTQKPVDLCRYLVRTYTNAGDVVLDPTCGSGSTGVACMAEGRAFVGIEQHPPYVALSRQRIDEATRQGSLFGAA